MPVWVGKEGLAGDAQADRRVHGGVDKALHQYPAGHYALLTATFPEAASVLAPGAMGENISSPGWDESSVAIGDVFQFGDAKIQVSQPRSPCWKIDHRFGIGGMAQWIAEQCITGWYFRVLETGSVEPGTVFERIERNAEVVTVAALLALWAEHRPDPELLLNASRTAGLSAGWVEKLTNRAGRLRRLIAENGDGAVDDRLLRFHPHPDSVRPHEG